MSEVLEKARAAQRTQDPIILLVDDEPAVLGAMRRSLRNEPYEVITAGSCEEALGWLEELPVDLVITDQRMPGMSGTELLEVVRTRFPKTRRAILTGYPTPSTVRRGLEAGSDSFLYKPWDDRILLETIRRILARGGSKGLRNRDSEPPSDPVEPA